MYNPADLLPGDIVLLTRSRDGPFLSRLLDDLIAWSSGPFVHAVMVGNGHLVNPLMHVQRSPLDLYRSQGWAFRVQATDAQRAAAVAWAEAHVGDAYSIPELLADAARFDLHWVAPAWYHWKPQSWTCSGFTAQAFREAGVVLSHAPLPAPSDLGYSPALVGSRPWDRLTAPPSGGVTA